MDNIGRKVSIMREEKNLTQSQLASLAKITQATLSYIESGKKNPSVETLSMICAALQISISDFLSGTKENNLQLSNGLQQLVEAAQRLPAKKINILIEAAKAMD